MNEQLNNTITLSKSQVARILISGNALATLLSSLVSDTQRLQFIVDARYSDVKTDKVIECLDKWTNSVQDLDLTEECDCSEHE